MISHEGLFPLQLERFATDLERFRPPRQVRIDRMVRSLAARSQLTPVIITGVGPQFTLVDGFKRLRAAKILNWKTLNATAIEADSPKAKAMLYLMNRSGSFSMIEESLLVKEFIEHDGLRQSEAAILLERHKSWVSRRLNIIRRLAPEVIHDLLLELIPGGGVSSLARIPLCNQPEFGTCIQAHRLTPNEIKRLADIFCKTTDPAMRRAILQTPREVIQVVQKEMEDHPVDWPKNIRIMQRLVRILEKDLTQKQFADAVIQSLSHHISQIKPILAQLLVISQQEMS
jgi:predicted XRE-type DNA-binding protein